CGADNHANLGVLHVMSVKLKYHQAFSEIVLNALLHLFMHKASSERFIPTKRSNEILVKFLKARVNRSGYAVCKKDIKVMIGVARKGGDLTARLFELNQMNLDYRAKFSQADELYILFNALCEQHGYESQLAQEGELVAETIYMTQEDIEAGFDEENRQIKPLPFWVKTDDPQRVVECVKLTSPYVATLEHTDEKEAVHFSLYREGMMPFQSALAS
ncbi:DUF2913 family protein, partial [Vibrio paucivorans]